MISKNPPFVLAALLALCSPLALAATCRANGPIPPPIRSFLTARPQPQVTFLRFAPPGKPTAAYEVPEMRVERVIKLPVKDAAQVTTALTSRATYTEAHLGCVGADVFGLRLEREDARLDLLIDVTCDHVFEVGTRSELGFLSDSGDAFFTALASKYGAR